MLAGGRRISFVQLWHLAFCYFFRFTSSISVLATRNFLFVKKRTCLTAVKSESIRCLLFKFSNNTSGRFIYKVARRNLREEPPKTEEEIEQGKEKFIERNNEQREYDKKANTPGTPENKLKEIGKDILFRESNEAKEHAEQKNAKIQGVPLFRGGNDFTLKPSELKQIKLDENGLVIPNQKGPSVNIDPNNKNVVDNGGAYEILTLPLGLQYRQTGTTDFGHYEIVASRSMTVEEYQSLLKDIKTQQNE